MEIRMNELIKIEKNSVGGDLIETVNARDLHIHFVFVTGLH